MTTLPVIGVPAPLRFLGGIDSLLSIVQMPSGVPVATVAIASARRSSTPAPRKVARSRWVGMRRVVGDHYVGELESLGQGPEGGGKLSVGILPPGSLRTGYVELHITGCMSSVQLC